MNRAGLLVLLTAALPVPAAAEVKSSSVAGFVLESRAVVPVEPKAAFAAIGRIGSW